jgi:hypothetical protein
LLRDELIFELYYYLNFFKKNAFKKKKRGGSIFEKKKRRREKENEGLRFLIKKEGCGKCVKEYKLGPLW